MLRPNSSPAAGFGAVSFWRWVQAVPDRLNRYADPAPLFGVAAGSSREEPTMAVSPDTATASPNLSVLAPSEAVSFACCDHVVPDRVNTYAAPWYAPPPT